MEHCSFQEDDGSTFAVMNIPPFPHQTSPGYCKPHHNVAPGPNVVTIPVPRPAIFLLLSSVCAFTCISVSDPL